jgi:hypothetical protein
MIVKETTIIKRKGKRNLKKKQTANRQLKVQIYVNVEFQRPEKEFHVKNFKTKSIIITAASDLTKFHSEAKNKILNEIEVFEHKGSNWTFYKIHNLELRLNSYNPLNGASYIPLPKTLASKKAIINIKNDYNK